jgi:cytochrome c biogenesis protein CcmG/thiol:disulfide interchange protein DsbE
MSIAGTRTEHRRIAWWKPLTLSLLAGLMVLFGFGLGRDGSYLPSALVGRSVPQFDLARLGGGAPVTDRQFAGKPMVVNFWASWCSACRSEHQVLLDLGRRFEKSGTVAMLGINYRDSAQNAERYLSEHGAFAYPSGVDASGRTGIDFGVYGLPETFFIDAGGKVLVRHVGPLSEEDANRYLTAMGIERP